MNRMLGKTCVVTGGGRGIGRAIALAFAREGADVAVIDRHIEVAETVAGELRDLGVRGFAFQADVSQEEAVNEAMGGAAAALGHIAVLVNNAGIGGRKAAVVDMTIAEWDEMIAVNLRSVFLCTHAVLPGMIARNWGRIISTSSQLAHKGGRSTAHYSAAKAGIIGFTRSLAYEVIGHGITVNAICPGPINTDLSRSGPADWRARKLAELPIGRYGEVEEIAPTAVLLASDEGSYYVGATLNPNGGDVMV